VSRSALIQYLKFDRSYHSFVHIGQMFRDLELFFPEVKDFYALKLAILYHDCVYDARASDNEYRSAKAMFLELEGQVMPGPLRQAERLIMLTKDHVTGPNDRYGQIMIDLDLAGLGSESAGYRENSDKVRAEYSMFTDEEWARGRTQFIEKFLGRPTIYQSPRGQQLWEDRARENLRAEGDHLVATYGDNCFG
jgi:predicted metal-dependent HD superfamily phosphohydrolase